MPLPKEIVEKTLGEFQEFAKKDPTLTTSLTLACHEGEQDAQYEAFVMAKNATKKSLASSLCDLGEDAISDEQFASIKPGAVYIARLRQTFGEPIQVDIIPYPFSDKDNGELPNDVLGGLLLP